MTTKLLSPSSDLNTSCVIWHYNLTYQGLWNESILLEFSLLDTLCEHISFLASKCNWNGQVSKLYFEMEISFLVVWSHQVNHYSEPFKFVRGQERKVREKFWKRGENKTEVGGFCSGKIITTAIYPSFSYCQTKHLWHSKKYKSNFSFKYLYFNVEDL